MWMLLSVANASSLDFVRFELTGDSHGVSLEYLVSAEDWRTIVDRRQMGEATAISLTLEADDYRYTAVVPLNTASRVVSLSHRAWPEGTHGELTLRLGSTGFDRVKVGEQMGRRLTLPVIGGVDGAEPGNAPLSEAPFEPISKPQPVTALPPPIATQPTITDPTEVSAACRNHFRTPQDETRCIQALSNRKQPIQELLACTALARPRHQRACVEAVAAAPQGFLPIIQACTTGLGSSGDALQCVAAAARHGGDAGPDVQACIQYISDPGDVVGCVKRSARIPWPIHPGLKACAIGFPEAPLACLARTTRGAFDRSDLVNACTTAFQGPDRGRCLDLLVGVRGEHVGGVVRACVSLYDRRSLTFSCIERARAVPDEARIRTCGELKRKGAQLACIGG